MTYEIDSLQTLIMRGWAPGAPLSTGGALLAFDACCLALAALALRRGMRLL
jgi:hypothetical protein